MSDTIALVAEYDDENTFVTKRGFRNCRACHRVHNRAYARRKAAQ